MFLLFYLICNCLSRCDVSYLGGWVLKKKRRNDVSHGNFGKDATPYMATCNTLIKEACCPS